MPLSSLPVGAGRPLGELASLPCLASPPERSALSLPLPCPHVTRCSPREWAAGSCFTSLRGRCPHRGLALLLSGRRVTPIYSPVRSFICLPWIHGCLFYTLNRCKIPHYYFSLLVQLSRR